MNNYLKNPERLIEIRDCIANNPQRFQYTDWVNGNDGTITGKDMQCNDNWCGSCACVAGHAVCLACPPEMTIDDFLDGDTYGDKAFEIFGSNANNHKLYEFLFMPWEYEFDYHDTYERYGIGKYTLDSLYDIEEFALKEAISRINWILEDKPLEDYLIDKQMIADFIDRT